MGAIFCNEHGEVSVGSTARGAAINVGHYHSTLTDIMLSKRVLLLLLLLLLLLHSRI